MRDYDPSRFKRTVTKSGHGDVVEKGDTLIVDYKGYVHKLGLFESSYETGVPKMIKLGDGQEIRCLDEGIQGMRVGDEAFLVCPANQAYGSAGSTARKFKFQQTRL